MVDFGVMSDQKRQERVKQHKGCAKRSIRDNSQQRANKVGVLADENVCHNRNTSDPCKCQQKLLSKVAVIRGATYTDDQQGLQQDTDAEGVHGEARRVDFHAQHVDDALSFCGSRMFIGT